MKPSNEVPDAETPRPMRTQADDEPALSREEARVAGITQPVYGDDSANPNEDDQRDAGVM